MRTRQAVVAWGLVIACAGCVVQARAARLADGTAVHVRLAADLLSAQAVIAARVDFEIAQPVTLQGVVVIPAGAAAWGAVQDAKKGKSLRFDIEGVRLPNQTIVKLRCSPQKTTHATKDEIKVETQVGGDLGAAKGSEYSAYLDQDVDVDVPGAPAAPTPAVAPVETPKPAPPAPAPKPEPAPAAVTAPAQPKPPVTPPAPAPKPEPTHVAVVPPAPHPVAPAAPVAPPVASAPVQHPAPVVLPGELITVECFSDPLGADIMIDEEFHGSTPSILKLPPGNHQVELRLMGYKPHSQPLTLTPGTGLRTVRMTLEKQP